MLFSLIAPSILRFNDLFQHFDSKVLLWTLIEDVIVGFFNNKLYLTASTMELHDNLQQSNISNNQSFRQYDQKDRLEMMFWSVWEERKPEVSAQSSSARDQALFPLWRHNMAPLAIIPSRLINAGGVAPSPLLPRSLASLFPGTIFDNCLDSPFSFCLLVNGTTCAILRVFWPVNGKNRLYASILLQMVIQRTVATEWLKLIKIKVRN